MNWRQLLTAACFGAVLMLGSSAAIAHRYARQIITFELPSITEAVREQAKDSNGMFMASAMPLLANSMVASAGGRPAGPYFAPQSNAGPTAGNWHGGAKEFLVNLNQGGAAGTYTLATATLNLAGNGNGIQLLRTTFYIPTGQAAVGGTAVQIQIADTTPTVILASTATATMTAGKSLTAYLGTNYIGAGVPITFTTTGTFSAGMVVVALTYVGQVGSDICIGTATVC
jgi:hypothetical protein